MLKVLRGPTLTIAALLALAAPVWAGGIKGTVKVQGLRSPAGVLVYLSPGPQVNLDLSRAKFVMDQRKLSFIPSLLALPVGATVDFPNNDEVSHNVFSLSSTKKFNLGSYPPGQAKQVTFDQPGLVELRCDVHAEMLAYIAVLKDPYYALTDDKGGFVLPDPQALAAAGVTEVEPLKPGQYFLKTWHPKLSSSRVKVEVPAEGAAEVTLELKRGPAGALYKR